MAAQRSSFRKGFVQIEKETTNDAKDRFDRNEKSGWEINQDCDAFRIIEECLGILERFFCDSSSCACGCFRKDPRQDCFRIDAHASRGFPKILFLC